MAKYDKETKFYWLQLKEDFFEEDAIEWLEEQENGYMYSLFYLKLCLKSLKTNGILIRKVGDMLVPYDNKKLAEMTKMPIDTIIVAMELLKGIGLIKVLDNGELYMTQLENMVGSMSKGAFKKQQQLERRKKEQHQLETESKVLLEQTEYEENGLPKLIKCKRLTKEQILLPTGKTIFLDEKRYGGNGGLAYERANGLCEDCGSSEDLRIHHENGYSNELEDLIILCSSCHGIHHRKNYGWNEGGKNSTKDKDKDKDKVKVIDKDIIKDIDKKESKKIYGEYKHIRLTDKEYNSLVSEYGSSITDASITYLDEYIEMKGTKYKSHYLVIRKWVVDAVKTKNKGISKVTPIRQEIVPDWFNEQKDNVVDEDAENEMKSMIDNISFSEKKQELQNRLKEKYGNKKGG